MIDDATFVEISQASLPALYRISLSIVRSQADAQDAVQQGLLNAWAARARAYPGHERAWLTQIVIRECRNIQRYRMRVEPVAEPEETPCAPPDTTLREAIDLLPEALRLPLLLKHMEGMTEAEVARALRLTLPAVKGRLLRARRMLAKLLREEVTFT